MRDITKKDIIELLKKPTALQYFFIHLEEPGWFEFLCENGLLNYVPEIVRDEKDLTIQSPPWWPGYYLLKVADKIPDKIVSLLKGLNINDNWNAADLCFQITLRLPTQYSKELLPNIDKWLDMKALHVGDKYSIDLIEKYIAEKDFDSSLKLLDVISKPLKKPHIGTELKIEVYWYREEFMKKLLPTLIKEKPLAVLEIIERRLNELFVLNGKNEDDFSYISRPSIGELDANALYGDAQDVFIDILRDTLLFVYDNKPEIAKGIIANYLSKQYSIYRRIAIYVSRLRNITELYEAILTDEKLFESFGKLPEYESLYSGYFEKLPLEAKKKILKMIQHGARWQATATFADRWIIARLYKISSAVLNDNNLSEYHSLVEKYKAEIDAWNKSDKEERITSWVGPTSPITIEELKNLSPDELVDYIKNKFKPTGGHWQPTAEGLARLLGDVVKMNPEPYADIAERFAEDGIYPTYVSNMLRALHDAWREGKSFKWDSIIKLCVAMLVKADSVTQVDRRDDFDYGRFSWTRGAVADLFGEAMKRDEHVIDNAYLPQIKPILFNIAENDANPELLNDARDGDYVTEAINCTRGKALEAVILYALRYARIHADPESEKNKGPFPPGNRLEDDVKSFLEKRMVEEQSPAVHSVFGRFFQYLYYLDQEWVKVKVDQGLLLPIESSKKTIWEADWQGYILFNRFYNDLFTQLKDHYKHAINNTSKGSNRRDKQEDERLAEHIVLAYIRGLEDLTDDGLVKMFFKNASLDARSRAIWFLGSIFEKESPDSEMWSKLKALWQYRLNSINDEEIGSFVQWLNWLPESIVELYQLIDKSMKVKGKVFHQNGYYDYIIRNLSTYPAESLRLAYELLKVSKKHNRLYFGFHDYFVKILDAVKPVASQHKDIINSIVNLLGEIGDYSFREYLVK